VPASGTERAIGVTTEADDEALAVGAAEGSAALVHACAASPEPVHPAAVLDAAVA